jgi:hypothetical protein
LYDASQQEGAQMIKAYFARPDVGVTALHVMIPFHAHEDHTAGYAILMAILMQEMITDGLILDSGFPNDTKTYREYLARLCGSHQ